MGVLGAFLFTGAAAGAAIRRRSRRAVYLAACLAAGCLFSLPVAAGLKARTRAGFPDARITRISGVLASDSRRLPDGRYADRCRVTGVYNREGMYASAAGEATVFTRREGGLYAGTVVEYAGTLHRAEDGGCLFFADPAGDTVLSEPDGLYGLRLGLLDSALGCFETLDSPAAELLTALFLGIRDNLPDQQVFRQAGCSHLLALSGMHVGIITGFLGLFLVPLFGKRWSLLVLYCIVLSYLFLTGFGASLNRSAVMFLLLTLPSFFSKKPPPLQVLFLSFTILAVITPPATETLSFQLSFLALGGILTVGKLSLPALSRLPGFLRYALSAALGAQAATAPLVAAVFGVIYPAGIIASIALTPFVTVIMGIGMLYLAAAAAGLRFLLPPAARLIEMLCEALYALAEVFSSVPGIRFTEDGWGWAAAGSAILILLFLGYGTVRKRGFGRHRGDKL